MEKSKLICVRRVSGALNYARVDVLLYSSVHSVCMYSLMLIFLEFINNKHCFTITRLLKL